MADKEYALKVPHMYDLRDHPEHARALGALVSNWSAIEYDLCVIMAMVMRGPVWRTQTAYYAIVNNNTRLDIIRDLASGMPGEAEFKARLVQLTETTRALSLKRNGLVHKPWIKHKDHPYILDSLWDFPFGKKRKVNAQEIADVINEMIVLREKLTGFMTEYGLKHPVKLRTDETPQELQQLFSQGLHDRDASSAPSAYSIEEPEDPGRG